MAPLVASAALRDLWAPDEPRYAMVAMWIYDTRDFVVMHRCGTLYPDKPPLLFWLAGALGFVSGWSVFAMRLVTLAAIALVAWMIERIARRWWGELEARWAPLLFLGFFMVVEIGARLQIDPLLTACCIGALYLVDLPARDARSASRQVLGAGLCAGLAGLAKGPPAWMSILLPIVAWRALRVANGGARSSVLARAGAFALAILPVAGWATLASLREPSMARDLFFGQHIERAVEGTHHRGPPWEYVQNLLAYQLLPWTLPVVLAIVAAVRGFRARWRHELHDLELLRAGAWFLVLLVAFSISPAKRDLYLLPAYPAAALLGARWLSNALRDESFARWIGWIPVALFALLAAACCAAPSIAARFDFERTDLLPRALGVAAFFAAAAALAARALVRGDVAGWARAIVRGWCAALVALVVLLVPLVDPVKSDRTLAHTLAEPPQHPSAIPCFSAAPDGVRFYGGVPTVLSGAFWNRDREPEAALAHEGENFLCLMDSDAWAKLAPQRQANFRELARVKVGGDEVLVLGAALAR
jgi:4-amino-4-deoxy-L-arabinose transferase-like glycosyltransferase